MVDITAEKLVDSGDISLMDHNNIRGIRCGIVLLHFLRVFETFRLGHCVARRKVESPKLTLTQNGATNNASTPLW